MDFVPPQEKTTRFTKSQSQQSSSSQETGIFSGGTAAARDALVRGVQAQIEADNAEAARESEEPFGTPEAEQKPNYDIDPALADPWDKPGAVQRIDPNDPLAPFRTGKGLPLEMPSSVMNFSETDEANLADFGHVAAREGWNKEFAQSIVDQAAADFRSEKSRPGPEGYDPPKTVTELRFEFGAETEAILGRVEAYCARRPALSAYLDSTGLGNSPAVIRMLAAVASDESIVTKAGAKKFIDSLGSNQGYWNGDRIELAKAKLAFQIADAQ